MAVQSEIILAIRQLAAEREINEEDVLQSLESAILTAYKKDYGLGDEDIVDVKINRDTGEITLTKNGEVVPNASFGRVAAQSAKQVLSQKMREIEKATVMKEIKEKMGTIESAIVQRMDGSNVIVEIGKVTGIMPPQEQIKGEFYRSSQRIKVFLQNIEEGASGETLIVSRVDPKMLIELFKNEVPELNSGSVEIKAIAREAGSRSKVAVYSLEEGIDAIGSCVGQKGVRISALIDELNGEKIDIIPWDPEISKFLKNSLSPAKVLGVTIDDGIKEAFIIVPDDQVSLAIGKDGQNVRLAAKLTGWKIDICPETEVEKVRKEKEDAKKGLKKEADGASSLSAKVEKLLTESKVKVDDKDALQKIVNGEIKIKGIGKKGIDEINSLLK